MALGDSASALGARQIAGEFFRRTAGPKRNPWKKSQPFERRASACSIVSMPRDDPGDSCSSDGDDGRRQLHAARVLGRAHTKDLSILSLSIGRNFQVGQLEYLVPKSSMRRKCPSPSAAGGLDSISGASSSRALP